MPRETGTDCPGGLIGGEDLRPAGAEVQQPGPEVAGQAGDTGFGARDAVGMGQDREPSRWSRMGRTRAESVPASKVK